MTNLFEEAKADPKPVKRTEAQMLTLLRKRYVKPGNGGNGEYAFLSKVRDAAGFDAGRTLDAVVMSLWPSRGLEIHGFEIKCSRRDWLRELHDPAKAERAGQLVDRFTLFVADDTIVKDGELPVTWGLMVASGADKIIVRKDAPLLRPGQTASQHLPRGFVVSMLRSAGAVPATDPKEIIAARQEEREKAAEVWQQSLETERTIAKGHLERIRTFERESGLSLTHWAHGHDPAEVGQAVRAVLNSETRVGNATKSIERARDQLREAADSLDRLINNPPP